ncbi:MarR family winged helix-turn-helix transcriptional regulator [Rhizohabitans arisaemae]|uniref:MarR family winged helix-turn-helix transcriptional regulator n=1 Tax=Rhizohabitans arisaemae TaxID=2720610 RepID=UPI0024B1AC0F|nr:MarR family transcriptional regulator [Rhizohabitans arisaemae]
MTHQPTPGRAALDAWAAYRRLHLLVDAKIARDLERDSGLSMPDYEVLAAVTQLSGPETCVRVRGLATRMNWDHSRLSRQLGRMERRGLIARESCDLDGRGDDVLLTEAGRRAYREATPAHLTSIDRHFTGALSAGQLDALTGIEQTLADGGHPGSRP